MFTFWVFFPGKSFKLISKYTQKCQYSNSLYQKEKNTLQHLKLEKLKFGICRIGCSMCWTRYNLPYLENETKWIDGIVHKYNVWIRFHICYVMILMIERNIAEFWPFPIKYECNNSKKWLYKKYNERKFKNSIKWFFIFPLFIKVSIAY